MTKVLLTHVSTATGEVVHRLREPVTSLFDTHGKKTVCGRTLDARVCNSRGSGMAGWDKFDETRYGFCKRCRKATAR